MIYLSPSAAKEIQRWQESRQQKEGYLRVGVKTGGCSGFYYSLELCQTLSSDDRRYESQGVSIAVDEECDRWLRDLKVDYSEDLMGGGFRFHNANTTTVCGCGNSFKLLEVRDLKALEYTI